MAKQLDTDLKKPAQHKIFEKPGSKGKSLTDYLDGDHYFAIHRDGQNLDRCRTQFKLVRCMEESWAQMADIVRHCAQ